MFLACFSSVAAPSFYNVRDKWLPEVKHFCPGFILFFFCMPCPSPLMNVLDTPCLLISTKTDLRDDPNNLPSDAEPVTAEMGTVMCQSMNLAVGCNSKESHSFLKRATLSAQQS